MARLESGRRAQRHSRQILKAHSVAADSTVQRIVDALRDHGCTVKEANDSAMAQCPAHADDNPSLSIGPRKDGRGAIIHCHAGCGYTDVLTELGLSDADLFNDTGILDALSPVKTYVYSGGRKNHRNVSPEGKKTFWQEGSDDKSLYAIETISDTGTVYLCEGEKAADMLRALGYNAVATGGAQRSCDLTPLSNRDVIIVADRDKAGHEWAQRHAIELATLAHGVGIVQAKVDIAKADIVEHIAAGYSVTELEPVTTTTGYTEEEKQDALTKAIAQKALELRILDEGRALWHRQRAALMGQQPPPMVNMADFLSVPDPVIRYRIDDLLPAGGRVLLAAQYKAGKTSLIANLLRSLVDGDPFLGKFTTNTLERVLLIDTELDEDMLRRWLRVQGIRAQNAINLISLRGRLSTFNVIDDRTRAQWAEIISGAQFVVLDCLRPCLDAMGLSEKEDAGIFVTAFDALCRECGAPEALIVHHMGHNEERSRGDSRLLDWPDVLWKIVRDNGDDDDAENGDRFFSAMGRDVNVPESQLDWQPLTRALTICGGGRIDKQAHGFVDAIIDVMLTPGAAEGLSQTQLVNKLKAYGVGRNIARRAVAKAIERGILLVSTGPRESKIHNLNPSWRTSDTEPAGT